MRLRAEMRVPGRAWLQFQSIPQNGKTLLKLNAYFDPHGLWGFLYWYALVPIHLFIFDGLIRKITERARLLARAYPSPNGRGVRGEGG